MCVCVCVCVCVMLGTRARYSDYVAPFIAALRHEIDVATRCTNEVEF